MSRLRTALIAACLLVASASPALAQAEAGTPWSSLAPAQRTALAPLQRDWHNLGAARQQKWIAIADRFPSLPADEQQRLQRRMANWAQMTPQDRGQARQNYQETRRIVGDDPQARWEAYQALPSERRRELAQSLAPTGGRPGAEKAGPASASASGQKSNLVRAPEPQPAAKRVAPTVVQARPGATTNLLSRPAQPPLHQQAGLPKIAATPGFVEPNTLLPQRGAQGAAAAPARPASAAAARR